MKINFMTWNTSLYIYGNKFCGKNGNYVLKNPINDNVKNKCAEIFSIIKQHLEKENAVAVLQEVPYKSNENWKEHEFFTKLKKCFSEEQYDCIFNIKTNSQIKMTVVIAKKGLIEKCTFEFENLKDFPYNCYVSFTIKDTDIRVLAVHSHDAFECLKYIKYILKNYEIKFNFILGDFNAGDYKKKYETEEFKGNRDNYNEILKQNYTDICNGETTTEYGTPIDHILINNDIKEEHKKEEHKIARDNLSDHYRITLELEW